MKLLMDTHAWIWWITGSDRLTLRGKSAIRKAAASGELFLSAISIWEVAKLMSKQRIQLDRDTENWVEQALEIPGLTLVPLTPLIACKACSLPPPFHDDPADQIIVASARVEGATILTADARIRGYSHCQTMW
ncbi:MAG: type II toxin-antitoxin system VapC family toxin [bacterium]